MWGVSLRNPKNRHALFSCKPWERYRAPEGDEELLITENYVAAFSVFKAVSRTVAGTTTIATPSGGGSLAITDLMISATKVNASTVEIRFTDDSFTETLFLGDVTNGEMFFSHAVKGRMQGWRDARVDLITVNGTDCYVTLGYMRLPDSLIYSEWNDLR